MERIYELPCRDNRQSFYGKAHVIERNHEHILLSYDTEVCKVKYGKKKKFIKLWDGYSMTTMRHINSFIDIEGIPGGGKKWWDSLPIAR